MTEADCWIRITTVAAVLAVAAVAGWISYKHCVTVVSSHGETGLVGDFYPAVVDGLIIAASMVLLDSARHRDAAPPLALVLLAAGIAATLAANVLAGVAYGALGAVVSAWPALSFVGCYELLMLLVRASAARASVADDESEPSADELWVPESAYEAAYEALRMSHAGGNPLSQNAVQERFKLTRTEARQVRTEVLAASNGHPALESADA